jgi:hypothetical protein
VTDRPIRAILDTSAIIAFTRGDAVALGEVMAEIADERAVVGLPVPCLAVAYGDVENPQLLDLLLAHPAQVLLADEPSMWRELGRTMRLIGRYDVAAVAVAADELEAYILTRRPGWYAKFGDSAPIIEV